MTLVALGPSLGDTLFVPPIYCRTFHLSKIILPPWLAEQYSNKRVLFYYTYNMDYYYYAFQYRHEYWREHGACSSYRPTFTHGTGTNGLSFFTNADIPATMTSSSSTLSPGTRQYVLRLGLVLKGGILAASLVSPCSCRSSTRQAMLYKEIEVFHAIWICQRTFVVVKMTIFSSRISDKWTYSSLLPLWRSWCSPSARKAPPSAAPSTFPSSIWINRGSWNHTRNEPSTFAPSGPPMRVLLLILTTWVRLIFLQIADKSLGSIAIHTSTGDVIDMFQSVAVEHVIQLLTFWISFHYMYQAKKGNQLLLLGIWQ